MNGSQRLKAQRAALWHRQGGLCHWCGCTTVLNPEIRRHRPMPRDTATIDHLDDRFTVGIRGRTHGQFRRVMACWKCNNERARQAQAERPIEELNERSQRHRRVLMV